MEVNNMTAQVFASNVVFVTTHRTQKMKIRIKCLQNECGGNVDCV